MTPYEIRDLAQQAGFGIGHAEAAVTHFARFAQLVRAQDEALLRQVENDLHLVRGGYGKLLHEKDKARLDKAIAALRARLAT